ncbi:MAG TPA: hypothetical protein VF412_09650 [Bdellovibrio sp.]|uniref:hypothetical protein n=1 Tax=Bdellovibrio sp. TaxID=28201 RepID=UPI002F139962
MKKLIFSTLIGVLSFASISNAQTPSATTRGYLYSFKVVLNQTAESTAQLVGIVTENAESYRSLRFFQLRQKNEIASSNCLSVRSSLAANLLMLGTSIQVSQAALEGAPEFNSAEAQAKFDKLQVYTKAATAAIDSCKSPAQSLVEVQKANAAIRETAAYVNSLISDL